MEAVLILYYSHGGSTRALAKILARGVESTGVEAKLRTVPAVSTVTETSAKKVPDTGAPYAHLDDLKSCSALALGSPSRYGNMSAALKYFIDGTSDLWMQGAMAGKPATVFTSSSSMHGGQESTLLSMIIPLLHHGMLISGLPYTETELLRTTSGGTPYGPSHVSGINSDPVLSDDESTLAFAAGKRLAELAIKLQS